MIFHIKTTCNYICGFFNKFNYICVMKSFDKMNTRELLALYRRTKNDLSYSDMYDEEYTEEIQKEISAMKMELNTREHIPNKIEAKKIRQEKAKKR